VAEPSDLISTTDEDEEKELPEDKNELKVALKHIMALSNTRTLAVPQVCGSNRDSTIVLFHAPCHSGCYTCTMSEIQIFRRSQQAASSSPLTNQGQTV